MARKKSKRTFEEFLRIIHGMDLGGYQQLNVMCQKALEVDYINRYGTPIKWY